MIGEIIASTVKKSEVNGRWQLVFTVSIDGDIAYTYCNIDSDSSHYGLFLVEAVCDLWQAPPFKFVGKLIPMTQITFRHKTLWTLDWLQMRRIVKYWRDHNGAQ